MEINGSSISHTHEEFCPSGRVLEDGERGSHRAWCHAAGARPFWT